MIMVQSRSGRPRRRQRPRATRRASADQSRSHDRDMPCTGLDHAAGHQGPHQRRPARDASSESGQQQTSELCNARRANDSSCRGTDRTGRAAGPRRGTRDGAAVRSRAAWRHHDAGHQLGDCTGSGRGPQPRSECMRVVVESARNPSHAGRAAECRAGTIGPGLPGREPTRWPGTGPGASGRGQAGRGYRVPGYRGGGDASPLGRPVVGVRE